MFKDYNMNQLVLPLDVEIKLQEHDIAFSIHQLVESIPTEAFAPFLQQTGCPAYHPRMMLKLILCGYTQSAFSGRRIEDLTKDSLRMMWLAQGYQPSYRTINRFRVHPLTKELLRQCFVQFRCQLVKEDLIAQEAIFIDGTKIEATANKFTFVWKRSIEKYEASLVEKSNQLYEELLQQQIIPAIEQEVETQLSITELKQVAEKLEEVVADYTERIEQSEKAQERKQLRSERKTPKQQWKQVNEWITRKQKYERDFAIFGKRNSYAKTDPDATFMRMKDDYMQNGQLKAGYNLQIATEGQYTLAYGIYANPTDTKTLIPFLDEIERRYFQLPQHIVADAGYGSEPNYEDVRNNRKCEPVIPYTHYRKEQSKKYQQDPFRTSNWMYDEELDTYICPYQQKVTFRYESTQEDKEGFQRTFRIYECEDCTGCPFREKCTKAQEGKSRKIKVNENWEQQKAYVRTKLSEAKAGTLYRQRKVDVEPVFGCLKANLGFTRFSVRGQSKVENEIGFALMAVNLRKYRWKRKSSSSSSFHTSKNRNHLMRFRFFVWTRTIYVPASFHFFETN
ncbi:IS1182 family transposase [Lysinibacillus louembei]|uniref:IS1182 family transposase n=1 Tax=Lysinibacillus louembei TaxID=1470088 RepID=A0ABZ0RZG3_9BACI|nr:IS1182 family transposase [Lysinibacillus louembei]WPK13545.1 IS1182 family transposase [Lysinibacillus louembei]